MEKKEFLEYNKKVRAEGLVMSRVPQPTKEFFTKLAETEFADDFGMTLKFLIDEFIRRGLLETFDIKLNHIIKLLQDKNPERQSFKIIKMLNGKVIGKGGNEKKNGTDKKS